MTITTTGLARAAGISAAAAGLIFIAVQINHPAMDVDSVATTEWVVRNSAKVAMSALALVGITGMYLRQIRQIGMVGLIGYLLFGAGYLLMFSTEVISAYVLPGLVQVAPGYVNDIVVAATGGAPVGDIGAMKGVLAVTGIGYMVGALTIAYARQLSHLAAQRNLADTGEAPPQWSGASPMTLSRVPLQANCSRTCSRNPHTRSNCLPGAS